MRKNYSWIRELALVTVVSSLVMLMSPLGSVGTQGDWGIYHNTEYVPVGEECSIIATNGVNHVEGTFQWGYGLEFEYRYDDYSAWNEVDPQPTWSSGIYTFDFYTSWDPDGYGDFFRIRDDSISQLYWYWCTLPET